MVSNLIGGITAPISPLSIPPVNYLVAYYEEETIFSSRIRIRYHTFFYNNNVQ